MFSGANQTLISGGTFTSIHAPVTNIQVNHEKGIKLLRDNVASGAFHNSAERYDPPKCHPGTREVIIKEIMDWIEAVDKEEFFLWLYGPAGAGKSAIAQSIAELCHEAGLLAATFFFSRTASGRNDAALLISTLAYQLTVSIPEIIEHISTAIEKDTLIFTRSLEAQLKSLIIEPLSKLIPNQLSESGGESKAHPRLIIIDGLDECGKPKTQRYILATILSAVQRYRIPIFFLVASRPEQEIRDVFNEDTMSLLTRRLVLDDTYEPDADIKIFLSSKFTKIKECHPLASVIRPSWPSDSDLAHLIRKASGQFIYASTVMKFVESSRHHPIDRLDIVFGLKTPGKQTPFAELDALYTLIFTSVDDIEPVLDIFTFLLLVSGPQYYKERPSVVEAFWGYHRGYLQIILADLHSVVSVPSLQSEEEKLWLFHASLGDFLMDKLRSGIFFIDAPQAHARMAQYCIKHTSMILEYASSESFVLLDDHLEMSCAALLKECSNAYPTEELLQALESFEFGTYLALPSIYNRRNRWLHTAADLSGFFDWIKQQCSEIHMQGCLCRRYMDHIDYHLRRRLSDYPPSDSRCQHLFTALTLTPPTCAFSAADFLSIVDRYDVRPSLSDLDSPQLCLIDLMDSSDINPDTRSLLIAFLNDRARSGSHYRDISKYIDLAKKCFDYLCLPKTRSEIKLSSTDKRASIITLEILSRFPRDHEMVKFLRVSPILKTRIVPRRKEIGLAINSYIKDYDLSIKRASPSGQNLSRMFSACSTSTGSNSKKRKGSQRDLRHSKRFDQDIA